MVLRNTIKWGIILGIAVSLSTQILTWLGLGLTNWFVIMSIILTVVFIALVSKNVQSVNGGNLSFINAIFIVIVLVLIARIIFQIYMFIYTRYIDPLWVDTVSDSWTTTLQNSGVNAEQINAQIQSFRKSYETIPMFTSTLVLYAIPQFILGFITSMFFVLDVKGRINKWRKPS